MDPDLPSRAIAAFERFTGLSLSFHDHTRTLTNCLTPERREHHNPWCRAVKAVSSPECIAFCSRRLGALNAANEVVCTRCHAGLVQWVVAGRSRGRQVWVLFAGVRQTIAGLAIDVRDPVTSDALPGWLHGRKPPPPVQDPDLVAEALAQLNARLLAWLEQGGGGNSPAPRRRALAIRDFIRARQAHPIRLADLAQHLGLSPDRTRHAVREACGVGFARLLAEERLNMAAQLLRHTELPVVEVARRCGFGSIAHFHARFRAHWGTTPAQLRRTTKP